MIKFPFFPGRIAVLNILCSESDMSGLNWIAGLFQIDFSGRVVPGPRRTLFTAEIIGLVRIRLANF